MVTRRTRLPSALSKTFNGLVAIRRLLVETLEVGLIKSDEQASVVSRASDHRPSNSFDGRRRPPCRLAQTCPVNGSQVQCGTQETRKILIHATASPRHHRRRRRRRCRAGFNREIREATPPCKPDQTEARRVTLYSGDRSFAANPDRLSLGRSSPLS